MQVQSSSPPTAEPRIASEIATQRIWAQLASSTESVRARHSELLRPMYCRHDTGIGCGDVQPDTAARRLCLRTGSMQLAGASLASGLGWRLRHVGSTH